MPLISWSPVFVQDKFPKLIISVAVTNLFVVEVSSMSSASNTTAQVLPLTLSTVLTSAQVATQSSLFFKVSVKSFAVLT